MSLKRDKVNNWLQQLFNNQPIPAYEVNEETIEVLYGLATQSEELELLARVKVDDADQKTEEYMAEASRLKNIIEGVGIPLLTLSNAGRSCVKMLVDMASILNVKDCDKANLIVAMVNLVSDIIETDRCLEEKQLEASDQVQKIERASCRYHAMTRFEEELATQATAELPLIEKRVQDIDLWRAKSEKYLAQMQSLERNRVEVDRSLLHEKVMELSEKITDLKSEIKSIKYKLEGYHSLPPDIKMAKVKVEEAKRELAKLERQLQVDVDLLGL